MIVKSDGTLKPVKDFTAQIQTLDIPGEVKAGYSPIGFVRCGRAACKITKLNWKVRPSAGARVPRAASERERLPGRHLPGPPAEALPLSPRRLARRRAARSWRTRTRSRPTRWPRSCLSHASRWWWTLSGAARACPASRSWTATPRSCSARSSPSPTSDPVAAAVCRGLGRGVPTSVGGLPCMFWGVCSVFKISSKLVRLETTLSKTMASKARPGISFGLACIALLVLHSGQKSWTWTKRKVAKLSIKL